ncbi:MAG: hypothetical protein HZA23_03170 [Nitrospirae bacterium]|nr:hypothetical protein [Nitrospirota bacterium]
MARWWARILRVTDLWRIPAWFRARVPVRWRRWSAAGRRAAQIRSLLYKGLLIGAFFTLIDTIVMLTLVSDGTVKRFVQGEFMISSLHNANLEVSETPWKVFAPQPGMVSKDAKEPPPSTSRH